MTLTDKSKLSTDKSVLKLAIVVTEVEKSQCLMFTQQLTDETTISKIPLVNNASCDFYD